MFLLVSELALCEVMLSVIILDVILLSVIMPSVMALIRISLDSMVVRVLDSGEMYQSIKGSNVWFHYTALDVILLSVIVLSAVILYCTKFLHSGCRYADL
jgi:hypothetical protein